MSKTLSKSQQKLQNYRLKWGIFKKELCTKEENAKFKELEDIEIPLPEDIHSFLDEGINNYEPVDYYRILPADLTKEERIEFLYYKKLELLDTIKKCAFFIATLFVIQIAILTVLIILMMI